MTVSSHTPEGFPSRCPLCGAATYLEFSQPPAIAASDAPQDAPCPNCGHLVWFSERLLSSIQQQLAASLGVAADDITADTPLTELGADSMDAVELIMELEENFDVAFPNDAPPIRTIGDFIRYAEGQRSRRND